MNIEDILFKLGVTSFVTDIITTLPNPVSTSFQVGKILQTDIGFIYGLSTYADGLDEAGNTLITTTQAQGIYLTLQDGPTAFLETIRMSDLLNEFAGSPVVRPAKYTPVRIERFDLSKSSYKNPNSFINATIHLKLWYIQSDVWEDIRVKHFKMKPRQKP